MPLLPEMRRSPWCPWIGCRSVQPWMEPASMWIEGGVLTANWIDRVYHGSGRESLIAHHGTAWAEWTVGLVDQDRVPDAVHGYVLKRHVGGGTAAGGVPPSLDPDAVCCSTHRAVPHHQAPDVSFIRISSQTSHNSLIQKKQFYV